MYRLHLRIVILRIRYPIFFLLKEQLCKLIEATTPCLPLVGSLGRYVAVSIDANLLKSLGCFVNAHIFLTTTAHEKYLVGSLEVFCVGQLVGADCATAEDTNVREGSWVVEGNTVCLHATNDQPLRDARCQR